MTKKQRWLIFPADESLRAGMTLIELIVVIALLAGVMTIALPNITINKESAVQTKLSRLSEDIQSAYDMAVLSGYSHRLIFNLKSGTYWLEVAPDKRRVTLTKDGLDRDLSAREEKEAQEAFKVEFEDKYKELAGETFKDSETEKDIPPVSPLLNARDRLEPLKWTQVDNLEWGVRSLGPELLIKEMQAEHHAMRQRLDGIGEDARAIIYVFPSGYIERSVLYIAYSNGEGGIDEEKEPYTLIIEPYTGSTRLISGNEDYDVHADDENS